MKKKVSDIKFNLSDFDYITKDMPQVGWRWEFMRRSQAYRDAYESFQYQDNEKNRLCPQCQKLISNDSVRFKPYWGIDSKKPWDDTMFLGTMPWVGQPTLDKANPVIVVNMKKGEGILSESHKPIEVEFLRVEKQEKTINQDIQTWKGNYGEQDTYVINGPHCTERREMKDIHLIHTGTDGIERRVPAYDGGDYIHIDHPLELVYRNQGRENVLMALIDISAPGTAKELAARIEREISAWRRRLPDQRTKAAQKNKKKTNNLIGDADIRKSYLIVYDLITGWPQVLLKQRTCEEVSQVLGDIAELYDSVEIVKYHYDQAACLVKDGYRTLL